MRNRLRLVLFGALLTASGDRSLAAARNEQLERDPNSLFSNTVDWYNPSPRGLESRKAVVLPSQLFVWVPQNHRQEAIALLSEHTIIRLSKGRAARLSRPVDAKALVKKQIVELTRQRRRVRDRVAAEKAYRLMRLSDDEVRSKRRMDETTAQDLDGRIRRLQTWKDRLGPYLLRTVALEAGGNFSGVLINDNLIVVHNAMASGPLPMEKCPVVAYLPIRPKRLFTSVAITR